MLLRVTIAVILLTVAYFGHFNQTPAIQHENLITEKSLSERVATTISNVKSVKSSKKAVLWIEELSQILIQAHQFSSLSSKANQNDKFGKMNLKKDHIEQIFNAIDFLCNKINNLKDTGTAMEPLHNIIIKSKFNKFYVVKILDIMNKMVNKSLAEIFSKVQSVHSSKKATSSIKKLFFNLILVNDFLTLGSKSDPNSNLKWNKLWEPKSKKIFVQMEILCNKINTLEDTSTAMESLHNIVKIPTFNEFYVGQILDIMNKMVNNRVLRSMSKVELVKTSEESALLVQKFSQILMLFHLFLSVASTFNPSNEISCIKSKSEQSKKIFAAIKILCNNLSSSENRDVAMKSLCEVAIGPKVPYSHMTQILDLLETLVEHTNTSSCVMFIVQNLFFILQKTKLNENYVDKLLDMLKKLTKYADESKYIPDFITQLLQICNASNNGLRSMPNRIETILVILQNLIEHAEKSEQTPAFIEKILPFCDTMLTQSNCIDKVLDLLKTLIRKNTDSKQATAVIYFLTDVIIFRAIESPHQNIKITPNQLSNIFKLLQSLKRFVTESNDKKKVNICLKSIGEWQTRQEDSNKNPLVLSKHDDVIDSA